MRRSPPSSRPLALAPSLPLPPLSVPVSAQQRQRTPRPRSART
jgi:hypothetical protein